MNGCTSEDAPPAQARASAGGVLCWSWNVNGLRSSITKGLLDWVRISGADLGLLQETRAFDKDVPIGAFESLGLRLHLCPAEKPGYSGVGLLTRLSASELGVSTGLGYDEFDREGRWLEVEMKSRKTVFVSAYFPNSQREGARLAYKLEFCSAALERMKALRRQGWGVVVAGDFNIAHEERDLANPRANQKNAGFLPEERCWFEQMIGEGFVDTFRIFEEGSGHYSWWSQRKGVRERNIGWRIDYHVVSDDLADRVRASKIVSEQMGSDHCPVTLHIDL
jgi:exodeoxyribonuclease-3